MHLTLGRNDMALALRVLFSKLGKGWPKTSPKEVSEATFTVTRREWHFSFTALFRSALRLIGLRLATSYTQVSSYILADSR